MISSETKEYINELKIDLSIDKKYRRLSRINHLESIIEDTCRYYIKCYEDQCPICENAESDLKELIDLLENAFPSIVPEFGIAFYGYKLVKIRYSTTYFHYEDNSYGDAFETIEIRHKPFDIEGMGIAKLYIPKDAKRLSTISGKCRCDYAIVEKIMSVIDGKPCEFQFGESPIYNGSESICYEKGDTVVANGFNSNRWIRCSNGIHFFMTPEEVIEFGRNSVLSLSLLDNVNGLKCLCELYSEESK